jgi:hypothetical protein
MRNRAVGASEQKRDRLAQTDKDEEVLTHEPSVSNPRLRFNARRVSAIQERAALGRGTLWAPLTRAVWRPAWAARALHNWRRSGSSGFLQLAGTRYRSPPSAMNLKPAASRVR